VQALYRDYVTAMDTLLHPDYLGVASETNLVRAIAPASVYNAVVSAAGLASTSVAVRDSTVKLYTTVQVETAWGKLAGPGGAYVGIDQDLADFGFIAALGLSSYPYLGGFADPDSIPLDYYTRLQQGNAVRFPMLVIEGGWPSDTVAVASDAQEQKRYIARHAKIQDQAGTVGWFQITFTDLDEAAYGRNSRAARAVHEAGIGGREFRAQARALRVGRCVREAEEVRGAGGGLARCRGAAADRPGECIFTIGGVTTRCYDTPQKQAWCLDTMW
jgi:hypothetical protein